MLDSRTVILVGHCGPDMHMLKAAVARVAPDVRIVVVNNQTALDKHVSADSLLLINRLLDGGFSARSGIGLIEQLAGSHDPPAMMLISNFEDAQEQATAAGARRGFGKAQLYHEATAAILKEALIAAEDKSKSTSEVRGDD